MRGLGCTFSCHCECNHLGPNLHVYACIGTSGIAYNFNLFLLSKRFTCLKKPQSSLIQVFPLICQVYISFCLHIIYYYLDLGASMPVKCES